MSDWRDRLPEVRGRLMRDAALAPFTWFRVGGPADVLFLPADADDLADFLEALPAERAGHRRSASAPTSSCATAGSRAW